MGKIGSILLIALFILMTTLPASAREKTASEDAKRVQTEAAKDEVDKTKLKKSENSAADPDYLIGPGDQLEIAVWKDEALTRQLIVLPDGKINFPLIGDLIASGKTVRQLKDEIYKKISVFVPEPDLYIDVKQVGSMMIYVIGKVNSPGRFVLNANINVIQALSMAGGLNPYAKRNSIKIYRQAGGTTKLFSFRYDDVTDKDKLEDNILLWRGDVIVVP